MQAHGREEDADREHADDRRGLQPSRRASRVSRSAAVRASLTKSKSAKLKRKTGGRVEGAHLDGWMKLMTPIAQENIRKIDAAGGVVACGTDQSGGPAVHREMELLQAAGIAPLEVIRIATYNSARVSRQSGPARIRAGRASSPTCVLLDADPGAEHRQRQGDRVRHEERRDRRREQAAARRRPAAAHASRRRDDHSKPRTARGISSITPSACFRARRP